MPGQKTFKLTLTADELLLLRDAMCELCNDSDLIWDNADEGPGPYDKAGKLHEKLCDFYQSEVVSH